MFIAHRGLVTSGIKENSMQAFKAAIKSDKYSGFELDIRESKDKEFVVYHDIFYKGKLVKNVLYKEMRKNGIPKLEDVLKLNTDKIIMIELKDASMDLQALAKLLNKYKTKKLYIMSFSNKVLKKLQLYIKNIKIGSLNYVLNSENDYGDYNFICIINSVLTKELIKYFWTKNVLVFAYGIKSSETIRYSDIYYIIDEKYM